MDEVNPAGVWHRRYRPVLYAGLLSLGTERLFLPQPVYKFGGQPHTELNILYDQCYEPEYRGIPGD